MVRKNINEATLEDLKQTGGLDDQTARSILDYRDQHGPITDFEDFRNIEGIGDSTVEELRRNFSFDL